MAEASLWFHLFRPITHTLHTVSFACHLMADQPVHIISTVAQWKEDLGIMRSWRKWSAVLPKSNGAQQSGPAAGVPMTMWEAVSFQFSRKLRAEKTVICERRYSWRAIIPAPHPQDEHSAVFVVTWNNWDLELHWAAFNARLVLIICSLFFLGIFCGGIFFSLPLFYG